MSEIYAQLRDNSLVSGGTGGLGVLMGLYADELDYYGTPVGSVGQFYNHTILSTNEQVSSFWNSSYSIIYGCNAILQGLEKSTKLSLEDIEPLQGEALAIRSLTHFNLARLFGDIPYITTTDYTVNSTVSRLPIQEVLEYIVNDILEARSLLPEENFIGNHIYVDGTVATALLAKVYLETEQWQLAIEATTMLIEDGPFELGENVENVFLKNSPATIWQLKPREGNNTMEGQTFIFTVGPPPFAALRPEFVGAFEPMDTRRDLWIGEVTNGSDTWYYPNKYKLNTPGRSEEFSIVFRLAEMYLIRAEARAHLGILSEAKNDLNAVRQRASLPPITATSQEEILNAIATEVFHEFFSEHGLRWFNLTRTSNATETLLPIKPAWQPTDVLLPIPQSELLANPNLLPQNPGY
ncbi:RagB/SusD family nutrient uptake outer membrane protein [Aequorivita marisscotiae]|uniref:RagB/SusD family nutrient uptake outer membrane protein n=1 Tax=Aequorivita marisscotiae TaxID=3040348 RepID=A0ABY8KWE5_9FLAO|nr:RagB/SusD family nutrient uptake outer membrane protein [Aequorivita sp. Ant34-E75]WGF92182.1 RagB/SusD family nutrient uptake outer membrane protein [Aequorivita sp. Ant34-E75]